MQQLIVNKLIIQEWQGTYLTEAEEIHQTNQWSSVITANVSRTIYISYFTLAQL